MIARRLRYDSAGFSPQAVCTDNIVVHPLSGRRNAERAHCPNNTARQSSDAPGTY
jgi:hypothetical protein